MRSCPLIIGKAQTQQTQQNAPIDGSVVEWTKPPSTILVIKKPQNDGVTKTVRSLAEYDYRVYSISNVNTGMFIFLPFSHIIQEYGACVLIEPAAAKDLPHLPVYDPGNPAQINNYFVVTSFLIILYRIIKNIGTSTRSHRAST